MHAGDPSSSGVVITATPALALGLKSLYSIQLYGGTINDFSVWLQLPNSFPALNDVSLNGVGGLAGTPHQCLTAQSIISMRSAAG